MAKVKRATHPIASEDKQECLQYFGYKLNKIGTCYENTTYKPPNILHLDEIQQVSIAVLFDGLWDRRHIEEEKADLHDSTKIGTENG